MEIRDDKLNKKAWWRFLKVIYIGLYLVALFMVSIFAYWNRPQTYESYTQVTINCDNGKQYTFKPSIYFAWDSKGKFTGQEMDYTKKVCVYGLEAKNMETLQPVPDQKFTVSPLMENKGSWWSVAKTFAISFGIFFVIMEILKTAFLYILGVGVWRGGLFYGLVFMVAMFKGDTEEEKLIKRLQEEKSRDDLKKFWKSKLGKVFNFSFYGISAILIGFFALFLIIFYASKFFKLGWIE